MPPVHSSSRPAHKPWLTGLRWSLAAVLASAKGPAHAFDLIGFAWPDGTIPMHLQLGTPPARLLDGATTWADVAASALEEWNTTIDRTKFTVVRGVDTSRTRDNGTNDVFFAPTVYGTAFDSRSVAVTIFSGDAGAREVTEADVIFNSTRTWNSYRGAPRSGLVEFRRVALHEFGHVLGLGHPDQATDAQGNPRPLRTAAIMNSTSTTEENLRTNDTTGARFLYRIVTTPTYSTTVGSPLNLGVLADNGPAFTYKWFFHARGSNLIDVLQLPSGRAYTIGSVQPSDAGTYAIIGTNETGAAIMNISTVRPTPIATSADTILANLSTRGLVGRGSEALIAGFVVGGSTPKPVLIRAAGPALADFGVGHALGDPFVTINDSSGAVIATNDNWENAANLPALNAASARIGPFPFKPASRDAALFLTLAPGSYTAVVRGVGEATGNALVEVYDADADAGTARTRKLVNIATRGLVGDGEDALIAGLVVSGPGPRTYLIRAVGPSLTLPPFNLSGALLDPFLQLYRGSTLLRENDDIDAPYSNLAALRDAGDRTGAFRLLEERIREVRSGLDAAMLVTLPPGSYTAKATGFRGATGVALIEIYEMPN
jgi:hypothetical protein